MTPDVYGRMIDPIAADPSHFRRMTEGYTLAIVLLIVNGLATTWNLLDIRFNTAQLVQSHEINKACDDLLSDLRDLETGQREVLLTGDAAFLEPYLASRKSVDAAIERVRQLARANPSLRADVDAIASASEANRDMLDKSIRLQQEKGQKQGQGQEQNGDLSLVKAGRGKILLDDIRDRMTLVSDKERLRLQTNLEASLSRTLATFLISTAMALTLLFILHRLNQAHRQATVQSAQWFATALHSVGDGVITTDAGECIVFMNPSAEAMTGWSNGDAAGKMLTDVYQITDEVSGSPMEHPIAIALREARVVAFSNHTILHDLDGRQHPIDDTAAPIRTEDGSILGAVMVFRDVSGLRKDRARLQESERRFRTMADHAPVMIWTTDNDRQRTWFSKPWLDFTGRTMEQEQGQGWLEGVHPDDRAVCLDAHAVNSNAQEPGRIEYRLRRHDGEYRWILEHRSPLAETQNGNLCDIGSCIDVTDKRRVEDQLRESESKFRTLADTIPQMVWMSRPDGNIFWYNRRWHEYTGTRPGDMDDSGWKSVHEPEMLPRVMERWRVSLSTGEPFDMVYPLRRADGVFHHFLTRVVPLRDEAGQILLWFGTNTDVTEQRQLQEKLHDRDRRKDQFLAMLAHELRNPLSPILNAAQLLKYGADDPQIVDEATQMIDRQVTHIARLLDDLLDVSRITRGKIIVRRSRIDLAVLAREIVQAWTKGFDKDGLQLQIEAPSTPVWVMGDAMRLRQVLENLLDNARKFTDRGGRADVAVRVEDNDGRAVLTVRDTGVGIQPELLPGLFEPFAQADQSLERGRGGLGLGLSLLKGLVTLHGGTVEAHSDGPGLGSKFTVRLPIEQEPAALRDTISKPTSLREGLKVLVVEDNKDSARSLALLLQAWGHHVSIAYSGPEALDIARVATPDVIVCDIGLPGMDGYAVARALRHDTATSKVRLIAVTGYGKEEDRTRALESGFDSHLTKPADPNQLLCLVSR